METNIVKTYSVEFGITESKWRRAAAAVLIVGVLAYNLLPSVL